MKEYEKQKQSDVKDLEDIAAAENKLKLEKFVRTEKNIKESAGKLEAQLKSFWKLKKIYFRLIQRWFQRQLVVEHDRWQGKRTSQLLGTITDTRRQQSQDPEARQQNLLPRVGRAAENKRPHRSKVHPRHRSRRRQQVTYCKREPLCLRRNQGRPHKCPASRRHQDDRRRCHDGLRREDHQERLDPPADQREDLRERHHPTPAWRHWLCVCEHSGSVVIATSFAVLKNFSDLTLFFLNKNLKKYFFVLKL